MIPGLILGSLVLSPPSPAEAQNVLDSFTPFVHASDLRDAVFDGGSYLWLASDGGALRFNLGPGERWTVYPRLLGTGPRGNDLVTICRDSEGKIWTGSATRGFSFFDPATETWDRASDEWPDPRIRVIRSFGSGIYIGTENGLSLKPTPNRTDICADSDPGCIVPSFVINDYAAMGDTLWVATDEGLGRFNGSTWDSAGALPPGSVGQDSKSLAVYSGELWEVTDTQIRRLSGGAWVGTTLSVERLVVAAGDLYALSENKAYRWNGTAWENMNIPLTASFRIRDLEIVAGDFLLATNLGLVLWDGGPQISARFTPPTPPLVGTYTGLAADSDGKVYAGTSESMIGISTFDGETWELISPSLPGGLSRQWIFSLLVDQDEKLWVGHCCCPNPDVCYAQILNGGTEDLNGILNARSFSQDPGGRMWGATRGFGIGVLEKPGGGSWSPLFDLTTQNTGGVLSGDDPTSVVATGSAAYFGHESAGLDYWPHGGDLLNGRDGSNWIHIGTTGFGLLDGAVEDMTRTGNDVWVGTAGGLHRFRGASLQERCPTRRRELAGDPVRKVNTMTVDRQGGLWVGTDSGILYLPRGGICDAGGGEFSVFTDRDSPLPDNQVVSSALNPRDGSVWFGTARGLLRVDPLIFSGSKPPPDKFVLYPNPMDLGPQASAGSRRIFFGIEVAGLRVDAVRTDAADQPEVFDLTGRRVGVFDLDTTVSGGAWSWNGRNLSGDFVAPGIYIVRAQMKSGEIVVLKTGVIR